MQEIDAKRVSLTPLTDTDKTFLLRNNMQEKIEAHNAYINAMLSLKETEIRCPQKKVRPCSSHTRTNTRSTQHAACDDVRVAKGRPRCNCEAAGTRCDGGWWMMVIMVDDGDHGG